MSETKIVKECLLALSRVPGVKVWRCNTGALKAADGRVVRFGFTGCPDICGFATVALPNGSPVALFIGVECKTQRGTQREAQEAFERVSLAHGAAYVLARSASEAVDGVRAHLERFSRGLGS